MRRVLEFPASVYSLVRQRMLVCASGPYTSFGMQSHRFLVGLNLNLALTMAPLAAAQWAYRVSTSLPVSPAPGFCCVAYLDPCGSNSGIASLLHSPHEVPASPG